MPYNSKELSIEELCAPLSAKIIPKRCLVSDCNTELTEKQAIMKQRHSVNGKISISRLKGRKK